MNNNLIFISVAVSGVVLGFFYPEITRLIRQAINDYKIRKHNQSVERLKDKVK